VSWMGHAGRAGAWPMVGAEQPAGLPILLAYL
jgi:hypothetical protein